MTINLTDLRKASDVLGIKVSTNIVGSHLDEDLARIYGSGEILASDFFDTSASQINIIGFDGTPWSGRFAGFNIPGHRAMIGFNPSVPPADLENIPSSSTPGIDYAYVFGDVSRRQLNFLVVHELMHDSPVVNKSASDAFDYLVEHGHGYLSSLASKDKIHVKNALEHVAIAMNMEKLSAKFPGTFTRPGPNGIIVTPGVFDLDQYVDATVKMLSYLKQYGDLSGWKKYKELNGLEYIPAVEVAGSILGFSPGANVVVDGKVVYWTDPSGVTGRTANNTAYTEAMMEHYGVVNENGFAGMTFGGHVRAFGDWLGLDGEFGIQGNFSHDGEGLDGTAGSGTTREPGGEGVTTPDLNEGDMGDDGLGEELPIIIDLDGDGVEVSLTNNVAFDFDGDGYRENGTWVAADDGFLVFDRQSNGSNAENTNGSYGDGDITRVDELALSMLTPDADDTDLEAVRDSWMNSNKTTVDFEGSDGVTRKIQVLTAQDEGWKHLRVWQDRDQDGEVDSGELKTLDQLGITQINLGYDDGSAFSAHGDDISIGLATLHGLASFTRNGKVIEGGVGDVSLGYSELGYRRVVVKNSSGAVVGYEIQFENGKRLRVADLKDLSSAHLDLELLAFDAAKGDARNNALDATGHGRSVNISGGSGADTIHGGAADDLLTGGLGADRIYGNDGDDLMVIDADDLSGGVIDGGAGLDVLMVEDSRAVTFVLAALNAEAAAGGSGNDRISTETDGVVVYGDVSLRGALGDDTLTGGRGDDVLSGDDGNDRLIGGLGDDAVSGGRGADEVIGSAGDDQLMGGDGADSLYGDSDDDRLSGDAGHDVLNGGTGDDVLMGGNGNDQLYAGTGDDTLDGGNDNDMLSFWRGDAMLSGGGGDDVFRLEALAEHGNAKHWGWSVLFGGKGNDRLELFGDEADWRIDHVSGKQWRISRDMGGAERVFIDAVDIERVHFSGEGQVRVLQKENVSIDPEKDTSDNYIRKDWGAYIGDDTAIYNATTHYAGGNYVDGTLFGWMGDDTLSGPSNGASHNEIDGGSGADSIDGVLGDDTLIGDSGQDTVIGGGGADSVSAGAGADQISGGVGNDTLSAASGSDIAYGDDGADLFYGGSGADTILGGSGADKAYGGSGADQLSGGTENDSLYGDTGFDKLYGDEGDDRLYGGAGSDYLYGGEGNDTLEGDDSLGGGFNYLAGGDGNDSMIGGAFDDQLAGGDGNDTLRGGGGRDILLGGKGNDSLDGGGNILDMVSYETAEKAVRVDLASMTASGADIGNDTISAFEQAVGGIGNDSLYGSTAIQDSQGDWGGGDNFLIGGDGADLIDGRSGDDDLFGGDGKDTIIGGSDRDRLYGGVDTDSLTGDAGEDTLYGDDGNDTLRGGDQNDLVRGGDHSDSLFGDAGDDTLVGSSGNDSLYGGGGNDSLDAGDGDDYLRDGDGNTTFIGGEGRDTVAYLGHVGAISANLGTGTSTKGDILSGIENLIGSDQGNDTLTGSASGNRIDGDAGDDSLFGGSGNDTLVGGADNDRVYGGAGNDTLEGGDGDDFLRDEEGQNVFKGGNGRDAVAYYDVISGVTADLSTGKASHNADASNTARDTLVDIENLFGSSIGDDRLTGSTAANQLNGGGGNDYLVGGAGNDTLQGADGDDRLYGSAGNDRLDGGDGDDYLRDHDGGTAFVGGDGSDTVAYTDATVKIVAHLGTGENSNNDSYNSIENIIGSDTAGDELTGSTSANRISGGGGADTLRGGGGADTVTGGAGQDLLNGGSGGQRDIFVFNDVTESRSGMANRDTISDFQSGIDVIQLTGIDTNATSSGDQAFTFNGMTAKSRAVWYVVSGDDLIIRGDVTGDTTQDFEIVLNGIGSVTAADFLL